MTEYPMIEMPNGSSVWSIQVLLAMKGYGPTSVRKFVAETEILGYRAPVQWQLDAFGQVDVCMRALGLRCRN